MRHLIWGVILAFGFPLAARATIEAMVSTNGIEKILESTLAGVLNPQLSKVDMAPGLRLDRNGRQFAILTDAKQKAPSAPSSIWQPDLSVSTVDNRIGARLKPSLIDVTIPKQTLDLSEIKSENIVVNGLKVDVSGIRFKSKGGLAIDTSYDLDSSNGGIKVSSSKVNVTLDPKNYELDLSGLKIDAQIPGLAESDTDEAKAAKEAILQEVRDYIKAHPEFFAEKISGELGKQIQTQMDSAIQNTVNPALAKIKTVGNGEMTQVVRQLQVANDGFHALLTSPDCAGVGVQRSLKSPNHDIAATLDEKGLNDLIVSLNKTGQLGSDWDLGDGRKFQSDGMPLITMKDGKAFIKLKGKFKLGSNQDEKAIKSATLLTQADTEIEAEVKPTLEDGKLKLMLEDVKSARVLAWKSDARTGRPVELKYKKGAPNTGAISLTRDSFQEVVNGMYASGTIPNEIKNGDFKARIPRPPIIVMKDGQMIAHMTLRVKPSEAGVAGKNLREDLLDPDTGKPYEEVDINVTATAVPKFIRDPKTNRYRFVVDFQGVNQVDVPILNGVDYRKAPSGFKRYLSALDFKYTGGEFTKEEFSKGRSQAFNAIDQSVKDALKGTSGDATKVLDVAVDDPRFKDYFSAPIPQAGATVTPYAVNIYKNEMIVSVETKKGAIAHQSLIEADQADVESALNNQLASRAGSDLYPIEIKEVKIKDSKLKIEGDIDRE